MYYVIETNYIGPNQTQDKYVDADKIQISTSQPTISNRSQEDWAIFAHGEYATVEEARAYIVEEFGDVRKCNPYDESFSSHDEAIVELYKPGNYTLMSIEATSNWVDSAIQFDINADTTDERIDELVAKYEADVNSEGYTLNSVVKSIMQYRRQELRDEMDEESF
ncbi:hypothetical protein ACLGGT_07080 [Roseovarius sp. MS2]|uniref:hypothetical protein n=1 Tax=Roseovarius sp. MS2 TaxID=3390728 RepID=UPI003EDB7E3A